MPNIIFRISLSCRLYRGNYRKRDYRNLRPYDTTIVAKIVETKARYTVGGPELHHSTPSRQCCCMRGGGGKQHHL